MKNVSGWLGCLCMAAVFTTGCAKETEEGGPGATPGAYSNGTHRDADENTFTLKMPDGINATQTDTTETSISLNAGDEFTQQVSVRLTPPAGVNIEPTEFTLNREQNEQKLLIRADAGAKEGDHEVGVVGKPATGKEVNNTFTVTVDIDE